MPKDPIDAERVERNTGRIDKELGREVERLIHIMQILQPRRQEDEVEEVLLFDVLSTFRRMMPPNGMYMRPQQVQRGSKGQGHFLRRKKTTKSMTSAKRRRRRRGGFRSLRPMSRWRG